MVDADAAKPHLAGVAQDIWSSPTRPVTGIIPPENTNCDITATTSRGMICSLDLAMAPRANPRLAQQSKVAATSTNSLKTGLAQRDKAPGIGQPFPIIAMMVTIAD